MDNLFLHDRPWISPWIKSISNELDITIHEIASQLSHYCDVISNRLRRHVTSSAERRPSETRERCVNIAVSIVIYGFVSRVRNKIIYVLSWWTVSVLTRVIFCVYFPRCFETREINTKLTLSWVLKQFVTRLYSLFSIYIHYKVQDEIT